MIQDNNDTILSYFFGRVVGALAQALCKRRRKTFALTCSVALKIVMHVLWRV